MITKRRWLPREVRVVFWEQIREGKSVSVAAQVAGVSLASGHRIFGEAGGVATNAPKAVSGRYRSLAGREDIMVLHAHGLRDAEIGRRVGRPGLPRQLRPAGRRDAGEATENRETRRGPGAAGAGPGGLDREVVPGAAQCQAETGLPRPAEDARDPRDDLPGDLRARPGRVAP
jgi:hypothetical protein